MGGPYIVGQVVTLRQCSPSHKIFICKHGTETLYEGPCSPNLRYYIYVLYYLDSGVAICYAD
jgi:hypothetical protein